MIYPEFLKPGDKIGIVAPSAGVGYKLDSFDASLGAIKAQGFNIQESKSVRTNNVRSAAAKVRAAELEAAFNDKSVQMVLCATGGDYNMEILPYIDWKSISTNPKWFAGYSDPTNISHHITTSLDIASIYGFNAGSFDETPLAIWQSNALDVLSGKLHKQESNYIYCSSDNLNISGRVLAVCLDVLANLIGTPFDKTSKFLEKYKSDTIIWFFDPFAMDATRLYLTLLQLKYAGYFKHTSLLVLGKVCDPLGSTDSEFIEALKLAVPDIPFVYGADFGHVRPSLTIINGSLLEINSTNKHLTVSTILK